MTRGKPMSTASALSLTPTRARRLLGAGATATVVGILLSISDAEGVGGAVIVAGIVATMWGLHSFGRGGEDAPPRKKPKQRRKHRRPESDA